MIPHPENGIVNLPTIHSVDEIVTQLKGLLHQKGVKLFALIDHGGEAKDAGIEMRPTKLLIFGNPKTGTPMMLASPSIAIDLPLKVLVWEDDSGQVWISYNAAFYLQRRHSLPEDLLENMRFMETLAEAVRG